MKKIKFLILMFNVIYMMFGIIGCDDINQNAVPDYHYLRGTWIDKESFALQFIDFYSENQARIGMYGKNLEKYDTFNYRFTNSNQIAINWLRDNESNETFHNLMMDGSNIIEISNLTDIPEHPNKVFLRRVIKTEKQNDTIIIGTNQEYFDFDNNFRLRVDSVLSDSRCPTGVNCVWEGNAEVRLELILHGNYQHYLILNTNQSFRKDTLIDDIRYKLIGLQPYPNINQPIEQKDYVIKVFIEKQ